MRLSAGSSISNHKSHRYRIPLRISSQASKPEGFSHPQDRIHRHRQQHGTARTTNHLLSTYSIRTRVQLHRARTMQTTAIRIHYTLPHLGLFPATRPVGFHPLHIKPAERIPLRRNQDHISIQADLIQDHFIPVPTGESQLDTIHRCAPIRSQARRRDMGYHRLSEIKRSTHHIQEDQRT
jgi:hypothetical protein